MFTFAEVMAMVAEAKAEEKKTKITHDDIVYTERYKELFFDNEKKTLRSKAAKIFKCCECGEMIGYWDLANYWCCEFSENNGHYICDCCYENEMGDDEMGDDL